MGNEYYRREAAVSGGDNDTSFSRQEALGNRYAVCGGVDCPHRQALRNVLCETIEALEQTRKSFKSKQIEALRKRLTAMLLGDV